MVIMESEWADMQSMNEVVEALKQELGPDFAEKIFLLSKNKDYAEGYSKGYDDGYAAGYSVREIMR